MLRLACRCGYPLWVAARWTGTTIELIVFDGQPAAEHSPSPLQHCPQCQVTLEPENLEGYPLPSSAAQSHSDQESITPPPVSPPAVLPSPSVAVPPASQDSTRVSAPEPQWLAQRSTRRVLVVDDDPDLREGLQAWLEYEGFQVASASDGVEALAVLQQEPGGWVVLLDLRMPRMDGWAVLHQIQTDAAIRPDPKIVLLSASWLLAQEGPPWRSPQVVAAVPKPPDLEQLRAMLAELTSA